MRMMRKELVVAIFAILITTIFTANTTQAVDPNVSVQPHLVQDETVKPLNPPLPYHPTTHQFNAPVTSPASAYDSNQLTYSSTNISQQPYPSVYSRPSSYFTNGTGLFFANAYDLNNGTYATLDIVKTKVGGNYYPYLKEFNVTGVNTTLVTTISSIDIHIKYNVTLQVWNETNSKVWYGFMLYVGTKKTVLQPLTETQLNVSGPGERGYVIGNWTAVDEPNDGLWSKADLSSIKIAIQTRPNRTEDVGAFRAFEVWARVFSPVVKYFQVRTFSPTGISGYSYLNLNINCSIVIGGCAYKILVSVGSKNTTVQNWDDVPKIEPKVITWERVTEPNDGWWDQTDLSNLRIIIETQIIKSINIGEFQTYEAWVTINPPTLNLYPSNHETYLGATVTNPTRAYDKNQSSYASISLPATFGAYFAVKQFNTTSPSEYASVDIQMRYTVTTSGGGQYKISAYVGGYGVDLQSPLYANQTEPTTVVWHGVCEPNDAVWSQADLSNLQVRVETASTSGTCTFQEYETWLTFPKDDLTVRVYVTGILPTKTLIGWTINLTFNKDVLKLVNVRDGPFLRQGGYLTNFAGFTPGNGWVYSSSALDDLYGQEAYGSGALATVTFKSIAKGNSMFNYTYTALRWFDPILQMPRGITHTRSPGWFQYLAGDVNGDVKVDVYDLHQLGEAYGTSSGNPSYDADADQDKDGDVDGVDLTTVSDHYGDT
jgi:hypothetical protein